MLSPKGSDRVCTSDLLSLHESAGLPTRAVVEFWNVKLLRAVEPVELYQIKANKYVIKVTGLQ